MTQKGKCISNSLMCVCTLLHYMGTSIKGITTGSDEHAALDQALLLVEILKSEYARILTENYELQRRNILRDVKTPTCNPSSKKPLPRTVTLTEKEITQTFESEQEDIINTTHPVIQLVTTHSETWNNRRYPIDGFPYRRRRRPAAYIDYGDHTVTSKWRRFEYDYAFGLQPGINKTLRTKFAFTKSPVPSKEAEIPITTRIISTSVKPEFIKSYSNSSPAAVLLKGTVTNETVYTESPFSKATVYKNNEYVTEKTVRTEKPSSPLLHSYRKRLLTVINTSLREKMSFSRKVFHTAEISSTYVKEPELSQAAAELAKEFGVNRALAGSRVTLRFPVSWSGTTKVYMAGSTRYYIPLPENHAFCFTNPNNALCKTII